MKSNCRHLCGDQILEFGLSVLVGLSCRCEVLVVFSRSKLLCFLGLVKCVFLGLVLVRFLVWCWVFLNGSDCNGGFLGCVALFLMGC